MWPFNSSTPTVEPADSNHQIAPAPSPAFTIPSSPTNSPSLPAAQSPVKPNPYKDGTLDPVRYTGYSNERLSMPPSIRGPILVLMTFITGLTLGSATGGQRSADRYRAENAHRFPSTQAGWYLYQRTKSYHTVIGGVKEGVRFSGVLSLGALAFMVTEEGVDQMRGRLLRRDGEDVKLGQRDFVSTVIAAMAVVGAYSRLKGMDKHATIKMSRMALKGGLAFGLCQDAIACVRKEPPAYVSWVWDTVRGRRTTEIAV